MNDSRNRRWRSRPRLSVAALVVLAAIGTQLIGPAANATQHARTAAKAINPIDDQSQSVKARHAYLVSLAQQEGKLVLYEGTIGAPGPGLVSEFESLYPFIKVTYLQGSPTQLETPIEQADNSGNYNWDIIDETTEYELLFRQIDSIQPYYTPDEKFHPSADNINGPDGMVWGDGWYQLFNGFEYNKNLMPNPPKTYEDMIKSQYSGDYNIFDGATGQQWVANIEHTVGGSPDGSPTKKGNAYLEALSSGHFLKLQGSSSAVIAGEVAAGQLVACVSCSYSTYEQEVAAGAPVNFLPLLAVVNEYVGMVAKHPADPGAAMLWADFLDSPQGNATATAYHLIPLATKIKGGTAAQGLSWHIGFIPGLTTYKFNTLSTTWANLLTQYFG